MHNTSIPQTHTHTHRSAQSQIDHLSVPVHTNCRTSSKERNARKREALAEEEARENSRLVAVKDCVAHIVCVLDTFLKSCATGEDEFGETECCVRHDLGANAGIICIQNEASATRTEKERAEAPCETDSGATCEIKHDLGANNTDSGTQNKASAKENVINESVMDDIPRNHTYKTEITGQESSICAIKAQYDPCTTDHVRIQSTERFPPKNQDAQNDVVCEYIDSSNANPASREVKIKPGSLPPKNQGGKFDVVREYIDRGNANRRTREVNTCTKAGSIPPKNQGSKYDVGAHLLCLCKIKRAYVKSGYWDGKTFAAVDESLPPLLSVCV
jgi:hypothetical protein